MQTNTPTTAEILALRKLGRSIDARWVEWAITMLENGYDSPSLNILAGETAPFNQFEMEDRVDKAFKELRLPQHQSHIEAANAYTSVRIQQLLDGRAPIDAVLSELSQLCIELDYPRDMYNFYLLHFAYEDLQHGEVQHYWPDANQQNIKGIVTAQCRTWLAANPIGI